MEMSESPDSIPRALSYGARTAACHEVEAGRI
jgi:hypothetical protein